jgi:HlyD family secretion protein
MTVATIIKFGVPLLAAIALGFGASTTMLLKPTDALVPPVSQPPASSLTGSVVAGLGVVEPTGESVFVATPLAGVVHQVHVVTGQAVKLGDPLFSLDDRELRAELAIKEAAIEEQRADLDRLRRGTRPEDLPPARARVAAAQADFERARDASDRAARLSQDGAMSAEEVTARSFAMQSAAADLEQMRAELARLEAGGWELEVAVAERRLASAIAQRARVLLDIERLVVTAPADGVVLRCNVRVGEYASPTPANEASRALTTLGKSGPLRVRVQVDEEDASRVEAGQPAEGILRGRVRENLRLRFLRIEPNVVPKVNLTGGTTERVDTRVLMVIYEVEPSATPVYVGQQVDVFIQASERSAETAPTQPAGGAR